LRKLIFVSLALILSANFAVAQKSKHAARNNKTAHVASGLPTGAAAAMQAVSADRIKADIRFLSSDLLEGRGTGQRGGDIAAAYIASQFELAGLKPMGDKGSYLQKVPMVGVTTLPGTTMTIVPAKGDPVQLRDLDDCVVLNESQEPTADVDADVIFMGYGIDAPEYKWNDYAGVDVKGKILLMLVSEPPSTDDNFFKGRALTYYGRWTYKYEEAARKGAAGVVLVHKTEMASYGWNVVRSSWSGERSSLRGNSDPKLKLAAWVQLEVAKKLAADSGQDLDKLIAAAGKRGFKPVPLSSRIKAHILSRVRPFDSNNVIGIVEGSDPKLRDEAVLYTAHYDHLGIHPDMKGDNIYNGALDNATGSAMIIEMARAAMLSPDKPKRSLLFAAVTAEEQGLFGSEYLGQHPPIPASKITLDLNFDSIPPLGIPKETSAGGYDRTTFAPIFEKTAADFGLKILPPAHPESGGYYRSDHFSMARVGVPAFSVNVGSKFEGHTDEWVKERSKEMGANYHQPTDEFRPDGDYRTEAVMGRFGLALGWKAADLPTMVAWKPGDEFEARRKGADAGQQ
jgi:Zn-dependent M28 family amino/carboxypeptidase